MNCKKLILGSFVAALVVFIYQFIVHALVLDSFYQTVRQFMRPEGEMNMAVWMAWAFLADLVVSVGLGYMYVKGYEGKGSGEAIRFGFWTGLVFGFYFWFFHWLIFPGPLTNSFIQIAVTIVQFIIGTLVFAAVYKPHKA